jgi:hypothetical protein
MWVRGENGHLLLFNRDKLPLGIQHRLDRGDLQRVNADGSRWTGDDEDDGGEELPPGPADAPPLPKKGDTRQVWQDFAVAQGLPLDEAAHMSKTELIEALTGPQKRPDGE